MKRGKTSNTPETCFPLAVEKLKPGDVILTASPGQAVSVIIRAITNSDYSHAILVADHGYGVESADYGVVKFRLDRFAVRDPKNIKVLRVRDKFRTENLEDRAVAFASRMVTREYASKDVLTALFDRIPRMERGTFFCSQLVCSAYAAAGLRLSDRRPEKVSPGMLSVSHVLEEVSLDLKSVPTMSLSHVPTFLDGPNMRAPVEEEVTARQEAFRRLQPVLERFGLVAADFSSAVEQLLDSWQTERPFVLEFDQAFSEALRESGLVGLTNKIFPADADQLFIDFYVRHAIVSGGMPPDRQKELREFYRRELERLGRTNAERDADVTAYKKAYLAFPLETIRLLLAETWAALLTSRRTELAFERASEILDMSLSADEDAT
jgi:hypothetical protein